MLRASHCKLHLSDPPTWRQVAGFGQFVKGWCSEVLDSDTGERVVLTVHELMENLARHSASGDTTIGINLGIVGRLEYRAVSISTCNRATIPHLEALKTRIESLQSEPSPKTTYLSLLSQAPESPAPSGLGLARICVEAGMRLHCEIDGNAVQILALGTTLLRSHP